MFIIVTNLLQSSLDPGGHQRVHSPTEQIGRLVQGRFGTLVPRYLPDEVTHKGLYLLQ